MQRGDRTKARVAEAAARLLRETGDVAIGALSRASKTSVGSIYHHFGEKAQLVDVAREALLDAYFESLRADLGRLLAKRAQRKKGPYGKRRFARCVAAHHEAFEREHPGVTEVMRRGLTPKRLSEELTPHWPVSDNAEAERALAALFGLLLFAGPSTSPNAPSLEQTCASVAGVFPIHIPKR